jgi:hypothetical protein
MKTKDRASKIKQIFFHGTIQVFLSNNIYFIF